MRDKSGAHVAPAGSGLGISPANSGGAATTPRAPGHERPSAAPRAAGHGRLSAASTAPGDNVPRTTPVRAPGYDCLSAAHPVPDHNCSGATLAAVSVPDHSPVSPPPAAGHDCSRRVPIAAGSPSASVTQSTTPEETVYDRLFTAEEVQALEPADSTPVLDGEIRVLQVLIWRVLAIRPDRAQPRGRRRGGAGRRWQRTVLFQQIAAIGRACDILQRMLKTQQALAPDAPSELDQLLDEAAKYMENPPPPEDLVIEEYDPCTRTIRPFRDPHS